MTPDSQLASLILYAAGILLVAAFGWVIKTVRSLTIEMSAWRVALFGMNGTNGLAGDVKKLREDVDEMLGLERRQFVRRASDLP